MQKFSKILDRNFIIILLILISIGFASADIIDAKLIPKDTTLGEVFTKNKWIFDRSYSLKDFYSPNPEIDLLISNYMDFLTDEEKVAQLLIIPIGSNANSFEKAEVIARRYKVGGFIFLKNRSDDVKNYVKELNELYERMNMIKPIFSVDGEPALLHMRLEGTKPLPYAGSIICEDECVDVSRKIADTLESFGIKYNFAPVCDYSENTDIIGSRSFGGDANHIIDFCKIFIDEMQQRNIVATAKHFPGHGTINGDTHGRLIYIQGTPPELEIFQALIDYGVISIMVGHIAVADNGEYSTGGKPSTLSRKMVTEILKHKMGFKGIVITDAMTMNAVSGFKNPDIQALKAGCDIVLMPRDESSFIKRVTELIQEDKELRLQVLESVRKVLKLKVCLGIIYKK